MTKVLRAHRRSFLRNSAIAGAALAAGLSAPIPEASARSIPKGDKDILRLLAALEILETDLWVQYNELGGIQDSEEPSGSGTTNAAYTAALVNLDGDMPQYIHDNTDDEFTHEDFINAFLVSIGAQPVSLENFRKLDGSKATGSSGKKRLTNLQELFVDTSWWTRYRDPNHNPDLNGFSVFAPAVPDLLDKTKGPKGFPAIPRDNSDLTPPNHIQAIANTAAFHFATIEQGGTSLYPTLAQKVTHPDVLRIVLSIGPTEAMHFQTWQDKAGAAVSPPFNVTDPTNKLTFPDLSSAAELLKSNLIMPEPCPFFSDISNPCSVVRPTSTDVFGAVVAFNGLNASGLFNGQSPAFFDFMNGLAANADAAKRLG
jgi:Ferritin-like domain